MKNAAALFLLSLSFLTCAPQPDGGGGGSPLISLLFIGLIFGVFYLLLIYPKQREQKKHAQLLSALKKGDQVITSSGLHGRVVGVMDAIVVLRIAENVKVEIEKTHIARVVER